MAIREVTAAVDENDTSTPAFTSITPVSGRATYGIIAVEDAGAEVCSSVAGTNGWNVTWTVHGTHQGTTCSISVVSCVPSSSVAGNITATMTDVCSRTALYLLDWDDGAIDTLLPSSLVFDDGAFETSAPLTHGAMANSTDNILVCGVITTVDKSASLAEDANYTEFGSSPFDMTAAATMGCCYAVGGSDLTSTWTWTDGTNWAGVIFEVAKAAASGLSIPIAMNYYAQSN